jgi:signal peptide peptidase SppA
MSDSPLTTRHSPLVYAGVPVPHGDQFAECYGALAIYEPAFNELLARFRAADPQIHLHLTAQAKAAAEKALPLPAFELLDGIAVIHLSGPMSKFGGSFTEGGSTTRVRRAIRQAVANDDVKAIVLRIDSPGGTVSGTSDLADDFDAAGQKKPTSVFIEDMGASAAYFVASQGGSITAGKNSLVGSIGVYTVIEDWSGLAAKEGVKVHVVRAGQFKGVGVRGTEVTADHLMDLQRVIDELNEPFAAAVGRGRRMSPEKVAEINDGRIHGAAQALALGLIDRIGTLDQVLSDLRQSVSGGRRGKEVAMSTTTETPAAAEKKAATIVELKAALPDSTADFREKCQESGLTLAEAKDRWMVELREQNKALAAAAAAAKTEAAQAQANAAKAQEAGKKGVGVPAVPAGGPGAGSDSGDAAADFEEAVAAEEKRGKKRHEAVKAVAKRDPALAERYEASHNAKFGRVRAVA